MAKRKKLPPGLHYRDGVLYARVNYRDGETYKSKEERVQDVDEGLRVLFDLKDKLGRLGPRAFDGDRMTFRQLLNQYLKVRRLHKWYRIPIEDYFGDRRIKSITPGDIQLFKEHRRRVRDQRYKKGDGPLRKIATVNKELEYVRAIFLWAVDRGWLDRSPMQGTKLIKKSAEVRRKRIPTPEEEEALLAQCVDLRAHLRPIVIGHRDTGLRRSHLLNIRWGWVDLEKRIIHLPPGNSEYKQCPPAIGITERFAAELARMKGDCERDPESLVFGGIKDYKRSWKNACRDAGIKNLRPTDLRHGYATDLMEAGIPVQLAMHLAGHTNEATHRIYTNTDQRLAAEGAAALDELHARRREKGKSAAA